MTEHRLETGVAIHGGVGTLPVDRMTPDVEADYRAGLRDALLAAHDVLSLRGTAVEACVAAVRVMEDSPLFNAGRGSNFDERGVITMDASIMRGDDRQAGAVAGVSDVRSPVRLAQLVMERSEHVLLTDAGAEAFARAQGMEETEPAFFHTDRRWEELELARAGGVGRPNVLGDDPTAKAGTVGAVARDASGLLVAATSTGGMANKTWGRVGDSPIIGAGTWASELCAVSCTGWGELFLRNAVAFDVHARMAYGGASLGAAAEAVVHDTLGARVAGSGGLVALDAEGRIEFSFNTPGMYRGWVDETGVPRVAVYR